MLWILPLLPVAAAAAMLAGRRSERAVAATALGVTAAVLVVGVWAASMTPVATWRWSDTIELSLAATGFGRVMVVLVPLVALPVLRSAAASQDEDRTRLLAGLVAFVGVMQLLVTAADLLTLLIGWELVGAASWALIGHGWRRTANGQAAAQAFLTTRLGDLGLYLAAGLTFASVGTFDIDAIGAVSGWRLHVVAAGVLLAAAAKSAQVPFAPWLFSAMAGPTQASALLHSATLVSAGAYLLIRVSPSLEAVGWFAPAVAGIGLVTALAGGLVALTQRHVKRSLAGSTSAQYGLMFIAVGAGSTAAAGAHLVAHALFKSLLFLAAGAAIHAVGGPDLGRMRLGRSLPRLAALAAVGAAALAAVPPLGGAWTKEQIVAASFERSTWLGAATLLAALLTTAYATRWWLLAFGRQQADPHARADEPDRPPRAELVAIGTLAGGSVLLGLLWLPAGKDAVEGLVGGSLAHGDVVVLLAAWAAVLLAAGGMAWVHRRGRLIDVGLPPRVAGTAAAWFGLPFLARVTVVDPVLGFARLLARGDDVVVDAGVRGAARLARAMSRSFSRFGELSFTAAAEGLAGGALTSARWLRRRAEQGVDAVVEGLAAGTDRLAIGSRLADDRGLDAAVEGLARLTATAGQHARQTQTGLSHRYYLYAAVGAAVAVLTLAVFR